MNLIEFGWDKYFDNEFSKKASREMYPGRVIADYGTKIRVVTEVGEILINRPVSKNSESQYAVGDWLVLEDIEDNTIIHFALSRKTKFSRAAAGVEVKEQIVAANIDTVFIMQSLNKDFNIRRLERYLIAAWESGGIPVVILTKADCCDRVDEKLSLVYTTCPGIEVHSISCVTGEGIEEVKKYFVSGKTVALLGSSGVGKSTLVNTLAGKELLKTGEIREDDSRGRHTTTHREIVLLPEGGLILDTPGMRTLFIWEADTGIDTVFGDIEELAKNCRFQDCGHQKEPGCAVKEAIRNGKLEQKRLISWQKLQKELAHHEIRKAQKLKINEKHWFKSIAKPKKADYNISSWD